ncbi:RNA 3'-terminal phosphate cyclase [Desulfobulbus propionicus]|nr:RNA 3'-phosphate cyclase [Chloroflexia bacterium]
MHPLTIDGSFGEGGGQLTRLAMALAAITGRPLMLTTIRAHRTKPGLRAQHLAAVRAVATLCGGRLQGDVLGSGELYFHPGRLQGGTHRFDVGTAGSISLVLQAVLPVALCSGYACHFTLTGGTDVPMAPPLDYLHQIFLPWLARMGADVTVASVRRGYYPQGGGAVEVHVRPCTSFMPLQLSDAGPVEAIWGITHVTRLPAHIAERMIRAASEVLASRGPVSMDCRVAANGESLGPGGAIVLAAGTAHGLVGAAAVAQKGVPAEQLGRQVGQSLAQDLECGATVDIHAADQLLVYAALANGSSQFTVRRVSQHAQTAMWIIEQFLPVRFAVEPWQGIQRIEVIPATH